MIAAGVLLVRGLDGPANARDTGYALACGACIAGYTLTDSYGLATPRRCPTSSACWS